MEMIKHTQCNHSEFFEITIGKKVWTWERLYDEMTDKEIQGFIGPFKILMWRWRGIK